METDLNRIRKLSETRKDENWKFRSFLKGHDEPDKLDVIVQKLYQQISSEIDCKTCANCCREVQPVLSREDIERFSEGLGMSVSKFENQHLTEKFVFNQEPCPFLRNNLCENYDCRPEDCISYPHLHKEDFIFRLIGVIGNYSVCPIVFNVYECLKAEVWHNDYDDFDEFADIQ
ncbi:MAG: YkgJ family cysteine cluster protein [Desulfobacterales bacterium]|nr:YkgJ family cysteine cluster protein [Desulfobacterales bacterium]